MFTKRDRNEIRKIRHERVRKKISGTPEMPVSYTHLYNADKKRGKRTAEKSRRQKDF